MMQWEVQTFANNSKFGKNEQVGHVQMRQGSTDEAARDELYKLLEKLGVRMKGDSKLKKNLKLVGSCEPFLKTFWYTAFILVLESI
jgi:hypothetical protein